MAEALDARELVEAQTAERDDAEFFPINKLPNELLVSVFMAVEDPTWVRHTFPLVCKDWNALYRTKDASPLHETLEVDLKKEVEKAEELWDDEEEWAARRPAVHALSVISWAARRAGDVRKLRLPSPPPLPPRLDFVFKPARSDFTAEYLGALVAVVGPSLTEISVRDGKLCEGPFWEALRTSVVPAGRLRSLTIGEIDSDLSVGSYLEPLGQLAGSLEELVLSNSQSASPLSRVPEPFFALTELRRLVLTGHRRITALPAEISSLKKLEDLNLNGCKLPSLPKELGELSALTKLKLEIGYENRGNMPVDEAFPAELGKLKALRVLSLRGLHTIPAAVGKLKSLEVLDLSWSGLRSVPAFVSEMKSLERLSFLGCKLSSLPKEVGELKSLEFLSLHGCDLFSLPKELGELSGLTELHLSWNENVGTFPPELGKMESLEVLDLSHCDLRTVPAFVGELKSLKSLNLHENELSSLSKELGELSALTRLDLSENCYLRNLPEDEAFPAELKELKSLRELNLYDCNLKTVPSFVSKLGSLEDLNLHNNCLSSVPKELGELSGLTSLDLGGNQNLGSLPEEEAFPAELGKMKSLRYLGLGWCGLSAMPAFVGELKLLEKLGLGGNRDLQINAPLDFLIEGCPRLREVELYKEDDELPWTPESRAHLEAFKAKLRARNPKVRVSY